LNFNITDCNYQNFYYFCLHSEGSPLMPGSQFSADIAEIERRFLHAGVVVPADRMGGAYENAERLLACLHWLRPPRKAAAEPSNTFSVAKKD
jgi:hypothetical protein